MSRYHVNPETQRPNICRASTPQGCKYYVEGQPEPPHFESKEEARDYVEKVSKEENGDAKMGGLKKETTPQTTTAKDFEKLTFQEAKSVMDAPYEYISYGEIIDGRYREGTSKDGYNVKVYISDTSYETTKDLGDRVLTYRSNNAGDRNILDYNSKDRNGDRLQISYMKHNGYVEGHGTTNINGESKRFYLKKEGYNKISVGDGSSYDTVPLEEYKKTASPEEYKEMTAYVDKMNDLSDLVEFNGFNNS